MGLMGKEGEADKLEVTPLPGNARILLAGRQRWRGYPPGAQRRNFYK